MAWLSRTPVVPSDTWTHVWAPWIVNPSRPEAWPAALPSKLTPVARPVASSVVCPAPAPCSEIPGPTCSVSLRRNVPGPRAMTSPGCAPASAARRLVAGVPPTLTEGFVTTENVSGADQDDSAPCPSRARTAKVYVTPSVNGAVMCSDVTPWLTKICCCQLSSSSPSLSMRIS